MAVTPRHEQQTTLTYDWQKNQWTYSSDVVMHNRKWRKLVDADRIEVEPNGAISLLEGTVSGLVEIRKHPEYTPEQKAAMKRKAAMAREAKALR